MKQLLAEIFRRHHKDIYQYLYSLCRDASLAEDLTSEVFLQAVKSIGSFRGASDVKTWLYTIARRRWADWLRKKNREVKTESIHDLYDSALPGVPFPEDGLALEAAVNRFLREEPEKQRQVAALRLEGYSYFEIANLCGISESSARVIWFRVKEKLKAHLEKEGIVHD